MPGAGQADLPVVSAGVSPEPLVTPANTEIQSSNAVKNLIDAFHSGFISQDDIVNRVGDLGQAKNKALLESLGEYVSPGAIQARQTAYDAETAQNQLAAQSAVAQQPTVSPLAELNTVKTKAAIADETSAGGYTAYKKYAMMFGAPGTITKSDGTPDYDAMGYAGNLMDKTMYHYMWSTPDMSKPGQKVMDNGQPGTLMLNRMGQPITLDSVKNGQSVMQDTSQKLHTFLTQHGAEATGAPVFSVPGAARKENPESQSEDVVSPAGAPPPLDANAPLSAQLRRESVIGRPQPVGFNPNGVFITEGGKAPDEARKSLAAEDTYKSWNTQQARAGIFDSARAGINPETGEATVPGADAVANDQRLAESVFALRSSGITGLPSRGEVQKWKEEVGKQPWIQTAFDKNGIESIAKAAAGTAGLVPRVRRELIKQGNEALESLDRTVAPVLAHAYHQTSPRTPPEKVLTAGRELEVYNNAMAGKYDQVKSNRPSGSGVAPAKTIDRSNPVPKDMIITTPAGRLKSLGNNQFQPL